MSKKAKPVLHLFSVSLPWNPSNEEEGTYTTRVWAVDGTDAQRQVAGEMAGHPDSGCKSSRERKQYVEVLMDSMVPVVVSCVPTRIEDDLFTLLAGPKAAMSAAASADFAALKLLISKYVPK